MAYVVFGKPDCPWCDKAVKLLEEREEEFYYYDLTDPEHSRGRVLKQYHRCMKWLAVLERLQSRSV